ncbi:MAG: hypothetical protein JNL12_22745 [Planctomycetes bacterium]|nr:hypothetical protein [Planctomycetota bacterium]
MRPRPPSPLLAGLLAALALPLAGRAQCPNTWQALPGCPGVNGSVRGLAAYDPDGAGPLPTHVVVAGSFQKAGLAATSGLALWNPATSTFQDLPIPPLPFAGPLMFGPIAVRGAELLVACYDEPTDTARVLSYDGTTWTTLGSDFQGAVLALQPRTNGDVVVGGMFTAAGSTPLPGFATWNGATWAADAGLFGFVQAIDELQNGDLLVAGQTNLGGIARRSGTSWSAVGGNAPGNPFDVLGLPSGDIVAVEWTGVHRFDGTQWSLLVPPLPVSQHYPERLLRTSAGAVLVGGFWETLGGATTRIVSVDVGSNQWTPLGLADDAVFFESNAALLEMPNGDLIAGGGFWRSGGLDVANVARFDGLAWHALADGPALTCATAVALDGDAFVVGGYFQSFGNLPMRGVAHWNGSAWGPLGTGIDGIVYDLARLPDGSVIAGGDFTTAGGVPARCLARWDGSAWSEFGGVTGGTFGINTVRRLLPLANGDLLVGGEFQAIGGVPCNSLARWNGTSFVPIPGFLPLSGVHHLGELPDGDLVVAGTTGVYRQWFGSWVAFGSTGPGTGIGPSEYIESMVVRRDGSVAIAAFDSSTQPGTARLHLFAPGGFWIALQMDDIANELHELPDGDLLVTGFFTTIGGVAANGAARIGSILPTVLSAAPFDGKGVTRLVPLANGDLLAVGTILSLDGVPAFAVARLEPGCRPTSANFGAGCSGSQGLNELRARSLPWLGTTFSMQATGLPVNSLALAFVGLQALSIPLPLATPFGTPGCLQLASIDLESLQATGSGVLDLELRIPDAAYLIGLVLQVQVAPLDVDPFGVPLGVTSTNALQLVIGDR